MTEKEIKEVQAILWSYRDMRERVLMAKRSLEEIEATITSISIDYSKERVTSSPVSPDRAVDIIGDRAEIGPYAEFPIKAGKFHFAGEIVQEKPI